MPARLLINPYDGLSPTTPQYDAGSRTEPPVSVPRALSLFFNIRNNPQGRTDASHIPAATAAALPPELPPADLSSDVSIGFTTGPWTEWMFSDLGKNVSAGKRDRETESHPIPNSSQFVLPNISAPDCCNSFTTVASKGEIYSAKYRFSGEAWIIERGDDYSSTWQTNKSLETTWLRCYPSEQLRH